MQAPRIPADCHPVVLRPDRCPICDAETVHGLCPRVCRCCREHCEERDFQWGMLGTTPNPAVRQEVCGYCTNWGVF